MLHLASSSLMLPSSTVGGTPTLFAIHMGTIYTLAPSSPWDLLFKDAQKHTHPPIPSQSSEASFSFQVLLPFLPATSTGFCPQSIFLPWSSTIALP